ncbi:Dynamin GTPase effector,Dynamin-type guanine nucleotide-binding (G) domain,Dynamin, GTPase region [Cinara cedri]|uniref:Dynamin GTPase effector,Dynamin-type guanine nucleotide-binding (G) domain,Dynamin, GTPase region n=1 Tax=Cinara cedri TaxID=506608 RepID=A0A5E4M1Q3_9HEMI|nr:Dynamin GTPase effector,Dynamin-type guanine nucleotide-binding (G) domain,Dynamin, GTPase region [Cinara cedri]
MESLITVMNKLQDVFSTIGGSQIIDLPQIVVVGSQSSGKSSVLESIVGKSFLPRGTGIVTRTPLLLHLINPTHSEIENACSHDWATFQHKPNVIFQDFDKVRKEIEDRTTELAGDKKNITDSPITLNIYSKRLYNLSFVDLPGLTQIAVPGQPLDIKQQIEKLNLQFISNPNSIILAIVPANVDIACSESLHIARTVDPNGDRTIAVVTKIDIMDRGTDATECLTGKIIPVKLGIVGVINRSQKDITTNKSIEQSREAEMKFFKERYPIIAEQHGTNVLGKRLQNLLMKKIKETCPDLKRQLYEQNSLYGTQVKHLKEFTNNYDRSLLDLIMKTSTSYKSCLDGQANNTCLEKLNSGASIARYFKNEFKKEIDKIDPLYGLSDEIIINIIKNASGTDMGVFMPSQAFDHLVKKQLRLMEPPSLTCVTVVHEELISNMLCLDEDISRELKKYPKLNEKINEVLQESLNTYKSKTLESVSKLIRCQEAYVNTDHPDFIEAVMQSEEYLELFVKSIKIKHTEEQNQENASSSSDEDDSSAKPITQQYRMRKMVEKITTCAFTGFADTDKLILESRAGLLTLFIKCYFKVIKKIIQDSVPKTIMYEMVNNVKQNFQRDLTSKVYKSNDLKIAELLLESDNIVEERMNAYRRFDASEKGLKLMREIEQLCYETDN